MTSGFSDGPIRRTLMAAQDAQREPNAASIAIGAAEPAPPGDSPPWNRYGGCTTRMIPTMHRVAVRASSELLGANPGSVSRAMWALENT